MREEWASVGVKREAILLVQPQITSIIKLILQEEKELTDMEVSLHRTRSLLGEKVIRLRHLEQSLHRTTAANEPQRQDDGTLSDLSSHSASSGISSTEFMAGDMAGLRHGQFKESSEIMQSLENLNSEIREIWEVLHKQQQASSITTGKFKIQRYCFEHL